MVEAINDPKHEEHEDMVDWTGIESWDVNDFDEAQAHDRMVKWYKNAADAYGELF